MTPREISTALDANYWKGPDKHDARTIVVDFFNKSVREDTVFNTLKTSQGSAASSAAIIANTKLRRLTPIECERLQGFPDGWTEGISDTQRYRVLGNAVTVNVIEFLGGLIKSLFTNNTSKERS